MKFQTLALVFLLIPTVYLLADFRVTWLVRTGFRELYHYNKRDVYFATFFILPTILSHLVTIWAHYYRADSIFQESIKRVSTATIKERKRISIWERHDPWLGYTTKYWILVVVSVVLNLMWFAQPVVEYLPKRLKSLGTYGAVTAYLAFGSGYAAMGSCGMLLFLVLRRSMLQAVGFTYSDLLPLHRAMGVAFIFWSTIHAVCYILYYIHFDAFWSRFNFDGTTRGPQNLIALVAYAALLGLGITSLPAVRRSCYLLFITAHRVFTVITFVGTLMHFPYYMIWYYVLPSVCLYLADRFVPKFIQSCTVAPHVECSFNKEADILTMVLRSNDRLEPLKPYYPGDYVNLEIPEVSMIYHPFTIGSYWAEDPYSITLYIRTFQETKTSWTGALATMCCKRDMEDGPLMLKANVDGVFGDRNHDYLLSRVIVIFAAGAAITTFMSLLKAMAAQIDASSKTLNNPAVIKVHLICTFRYESELYAYGDFMHRITHDPKFTSWLHTEIYVSRPDKQTPPPVCPSGLCASEFVCGRIEEDEDGQIISESTSLLAGFKKPQYGSDIMGCGGCGDNGTKGCCMESNAGAQCSSSSASSMTITNATSACSPDPLSIQATTTASDDPMEYRYKCLPTFAQASSASIATVHATKDLFATSVILLVPMLVFLWSRSIPWEGTYKGETHWCRTTFESNQHMTNRCMWSYSILPGVVHIVVASVLGYAGLWAARKTNLCSTSKRATRDADSWRPGSASVSDAYRNLVAGLSHDHNNDTRTGDKSMMKGSIIFQRGRIQVNHHIQELKGLGIGCEDVKDENDGGVLVFGGGPDAFVDMIEESCKKTGWVVDFHRETWAP